MADPAVETTLVTAAPSSVPTTPSRDAATAAITVATPLATSCDQLRSGRRPPTSGRSAMILPSSGLKPPRFATHELRLCVPVAVRDTGHAGRGVAVWFPDEQWAKGSARIRQVG